MDNPNRSYITSALRKLLTPVIRMMLRNGLTYKEFSNLAKEMFVDVSAKDYGVRGRETNTSRIAVITGIDRKEVKRIRDSLKACGAVDQSQLKQDRITRLLSAWHRDQDFLDTNGLPKLLPIDGKISFSLLVKRHAGDVPLKALMKEMIRVGVIEPTDNDQLRVLKQALIPSQSDPEALLRAGSVIHDMGATLHHNLYEGDAEKALRFERRASNRNIHPKHLSEFKDLVETEGQAFLVRMDNWLSDHEIEEGDEHSKPVRLGIGTYVFEEKEES